MQAKSRLLLLGALIASASVLTGLFYFAKGNMVYYWRTDELADRAQEKGLEAISQTMVRLGAVVKNETKSWSAETQTLRFIATNFAVNESGESMGGVITEIPVFSQGAPPAMFREGIAVVVEGYYAQPNCTSIAAEIAKAEECLGDYAVGAFRAQADRCRLSLNAGRYGEACSQNAFAQGPTFVAEDLLVKHSNEYRLAEEDVNPADLYKPVEGL